MNLLRSLATISSLTLLSRILGFVRDTVIARSFGAGIATDAFFVAFKLPNLLRRLFAEGAFSQAFVPILAEYRSQQGEDATIRLISQVASLLTLTLIGVTVIALLAAPWVVYISAPGFSAQPEKFALTVDLLRLVFPYLILISLVSLAAGILNTWSRFAIPAVTPVLLNVGMIAAALWLAPYVEPPIYALGLGVLLGGILQLALQIPALRRIGMLPRPTLRFDDPGVRRVLKLMAPATLGVSVAQISLLINTIFASFLVTGSVSWLYYADRLMEFPTGLLGVALGTILLPSLARYHTEGARDEYSRLLDWGLRLTWLLALPAAVALALLSVPLIATLFHYGAFTDTDLLQTRAALIAYSIGLPGLILVKILAPGFYARQNIRTPVKIAVFTLIATQLMNLLFIGPLAHAGLALAIGLGACLNAGLLYFLLRRNGIYCPEPGWLAYFSKLVIATSLMAITLYFLTGTHALWLTRSAPERILHLLVLVAAGAGIYFLSLLAMGLRVRQFSRRGVS
jgi:putative peptidoglycan lipid II flippase